MQEKGLEPSRHCCHTDLNRARLPIPPFLHENYPYTILTNPIGLVNARGGT